MLTIQMTLELMWCITGNDPYAKAFFGVFAGLFMTTLALTFITEDLD